MATLAEAGRITDGVVAGEIARLQRLWQARGKFGPADAAPDLEALLGEDAAAQLDAFDALQLQAVVNMCRQSRSLSDAGRKLFAVSRTAKRQPNDADRLKKYLARFGLTWDALQA
jgi:transcriptional regulatory protein RtcR